jgi:hypothetical protein
MAVRSPWFSKDWILKRVASRRTALSSKATFCCVGDILIRRRTPRAVIGVAIASGGSLLGVEKIEEGFWIFVIVNRGCKG